ncbi:hypothetical protein [Variovorax sp. KK3]|uniref:hypothetical protein n=1 Tax=Variovorax sp. KK3 TaxID=1855728 RepID=UPI00097C4E7A|nr:hypothetical protein [Variovorax sp. KK3]
MRAHRLATIVLLTLGVGLSLQACAGIKPASGGSAAMVAAPMKPGGSGIAVQYRIDGEPQAGVAVPVVLRFEGITAPAGGSVRFTGDGGLTIAGSSGSQALPAGQVTTITLQVATDADGIGYLNVFTTQNGATSATSITVQTSKAPSALPKASGLKQTPEGDKIITMPAK